VTTKNRMNIAIEIQRGRRLARIDLLIAQPLRTFAVACPNQEVGYVVKRYLQPSVVMQGIF